jgi:hypothetical protein
VNSGCPFGGDFLVHFPAHPVWFWLILLAPLLVWLALWVAVNTSNLSLKPLTPWLLAAYGVFAVPYFLLFDPVSGGHKVLRLVTGAAFWTCWLLSMWIKARYNSEVLRAPGAKWFLPWNAAAFSIPANLRIHVRNIDSVSPWYVEKLGLHKMAAGLSEDSGSAVFRFKEDGKLVTLTTSGAAATTPTPILFTKKIGKIRSVLMARGVDAGAIDRDRQGIHYFEIHDPEGNVVEVVEEQ